MSRDKVALVTGAASGIQVGFARNRIVLRGRRRIFIVLTRSGSQDLRVMRAKPIIL